MGEFYGSECRAYVVGPGSIHPRGSSYQIIRDTPIKELNLFDLDELLFKKVQSTRFESIRKKIPINNSCMKLHRLTDQLNLRIEDWAMPIGARKRSVEFQGSHPIHGSTYGQNFSINPQKNVFFCFRCNCGGDPVLWLYLKATGKPCDSIANGLPQGGFQQVVEYLWDHGYGDRLSALGHKRVVKHDNS